MKSLKTKFLIAIFTTGTALGGVTYYAAQHRDIPVEAKTKPVVEVNSRSSEEEPTPSEKVTPKRVTRTESTTVLKPSMDDPLNIKFQQETMDVAKGQDPLVFSLNEYLKQIPSVPKDAKVLSVKIEGSTATVNFNGQIMAGYGTSDEKALLDGVCATVGLNKSVKSVKILIDGKESETIGGHIELTDPLPVVRL